MVTTKYRLQEKQNLTYSAEKTFDLKLETFIFGVLMIFENKQGNH